MAFRQRRGGAVTRSRRRLLLLATDDKEEKEEEEEEEKAEPKEAEAKVNVEEEKAEPKEVKAKVKVEEVEEEDLSVATAAGWQSLTDLFSTFKRSVSKELKASPVAIGVDGAAGADADDADAAAAASLAANKQQRQKILGDLDEIAYKLATAQREAVSTREELDDLMEAKKAYTETRTWELERMEEMTGENIRLREAAGRAEAAQEKLDAVKKEAAAARAAAAAEYKRLKEQIEAETDRLNAENAEYGAAAAAAEAEAAAAAVEAEKAEQRAATAELSQAKLEATLAQTREAATGAAAAAERAAAEERGRFAEQLTVANAQLAGLEEANREATGRLFALDSLAKRETAEKEAKAAALEATQQNLAAVEARLADETASNRQREAALARDLEDRKAEFERSVATLEEAKAAAETRLEGELDRTRSEARQREIALGCEVTLLEGENAALEADRFKVRTLAGLLGREVVRRAKSGPAKAAQGAREVGRKTKGWVTSGAAMDDLIAVALAVATLRDIPKELRGEVPSSSVVLEESDSSSATSESDAALELLDRVDRGRY